METKEIFHKNLKRLGDYFGVPITKNIAQAYYDALYYIESIIFGDICTKIINDRKPFKTQFPTITQFGPLYESNNPQHEPGEFQEQECEECNKEGLIYYKFWHFKLGMVYQAHVACARCRNWKKHYSTLESHAVYAEKQFLYRHPGIEQSTKEQLCLKYGVLEVLDDGVFKMTKDELSERVLELYGGTG